MRRRAATALAVPFCALLLGVSGCGVIPEDWKTPAFMQSDEDYDSRLPTITGDVGEDPEVAFPDIAPPDEQLTGTVKEGEEDGALIRGDDMVLVHTVDYQWTARGETEFTRSTYETGAPVLLQMDQMTEELSQAIVDETVGSRLAFLFPPMTEEERQQAESMGQEAPEGASLTIVDVVDRYGKGDVVPGEQSTDGGDGLPTAPDPGRAIPEITIPEDTDPPKDLEIVPLIEGDGPEVAEGQQVVTQYTGVRWDDGEVFDSTWNAGKDGTPFSFQVGVGGVIEGWDEGLVGQKVGSRVMLVIPEDMAYGEDAADSGAPAGTLVFVVDLLGAFDSAPAEEAPEEEAPEEEAAPEGGDAEATEE
ncbi:FKBP-type peptidyl-prolyl cis-trans isomerase [Actinorugispora endophytica]|uniref:peptidylprolyl isomerase n=1 Tax=Actinorugispora endophytica TaxID=1605990 RepID=A0A4R6UKU0_9ACTN|nr:FKBP-type peptidyl-prolyl cis-trans isomerase [Actinorugispora endophytica]TDQ45735.1 peptidylprolyl isomerase [Actinorugispora endophytica]